jgi:hypothetical protein
MENIYYICITMEECLLLAYICGNCLLIPLTGKARTVSSRSPPIRISAEPVIARRCLAMDCSSFQASCRNIIEEFVWRKRRKARNPSVRIVGAPREIRTGHPWNKVRSAIVWSSSLGDPIVARLVNEPDSIQPVAPTYMRWSCHGESDAVWFGLVFSTKRNNLQ